MIDFELVVWAWALF